MATQTLAAPTLSGALTESAKIQAPAAKRWLHRLMDFIVETQTRRAQRAIAMHIRSRRLEFTPLDAQQPPH